MLDDALKNIKESLARDGYDLTSMEENNKIDVYIKAGSDSCADCLVPEAVIKKQISKALLENNIFYDKLFIHMP